jgi:hypothetical protein
MATARPMRSVVAAMPAAWRRRPSVNDG